tara:strand:+ start:845 stop:1678 length:834 start_codon:yes stop_codon:yes gene_type:complete
MLDNIAVVLRGHLRTWEWNAPQVFTFYSSIAHNVDYYISTWATPQLRDVKIDITFRENLPKAFLKVGFQDREYTSWGGPALLSLHILPYVRQQHKKTPYDVIFDSRPDVAPKLMLGESICPIQENTLYTTNFTNLLDKNGDRNIGMMDHMLVSKFNVFEAMCDRIIIDSADTKECHVDMLDFAKKQGFRVSNSLPWMDATMIRPCGMARFDNVQDEVYGRNLIEPEQFPTWESCTLEQKIELLDMQNIEHLDYITNNPTINLQPYTDVVRDQFVNNK